MRYEAFSAGRGAKGAEFSGAIPPPFEKGFDKRMERVHSANMDVKRTLNETAMATIKGNYPHHRSFEPRPMRTGEILAFAEDIRRQVAGLVHRQAADVRRLAECTASLLVNGVAYELVWDFDNAVHDDDGRPVMGVCEHDPDEPAQVMISINGAAMSGRPELERSTALHELGHALFDMPAAVHAGRLCRLDLRLGRAKPSGRAPMDWREWRANEFMGAFLAPPAIFHQRLVRLAHEAGLRLVMCPSLGKLGLPVIDGRRADGVVFGEVVDLLAETFGVTAEFARVRIDKYRLLAGRED